MPSLTRRHLLGATIGLGLAPTRWRIAHSAPRWRHYPFTLGVASGAPAHDGFVIWTRLAPNPLCSNPQEPGGMSGPGVPVEYEIAADENMRRIVHRSRPVAVAAYGYSVHAQVQGLEAGRPYWYRFICGDASSRIGRAMTLPRADATLQRARLGFVSCSNYEHGYFAAYRHLAAEHPDFVLYLGDYIYEYTDPKSTTVVRRHSDGRHADNLHTYRNRYAQYHLDEDLQRLRALSTSLITWDDHEVVNDYGEFRTQDFGDPQRFMQRRGAAYQAFYENMPVTPARRPEGPFLRLYDRFTLGNLAQIHMTDARQYRSPAACYGPPHNLPGRLVSPHECPELLSESRSMLGTAQEAWLMDGLASSQARWNILGQSLLTAQFKRRDKSSNVVFWSDDWNGYPASRRRLLRHIHEARVANVISLGGDVHSFWANDLKLDFDDPASPTVATEFVGSSISANGPTFDFAAFLPENPHVRFFDKSVRGYVSVELTPERMTATFRAIDDPRDPNTAVRDLRTFIVENGRPGVTNS